MEWVNLFEAIWLEAKYQQFRKLRGIHVHRRLWFFVCRQEILHIRNLSSS